jgi:hypothetical protein
VIGLAILCALVTGCNDDTATPSPARPTRTPAASTTPEATPTPTPKPTVRPTPTPTPRPATAPIARVTFKNMELDALGTPDGHSRTFIFTSDGRGPVSIAVVKTNTSVRATRLCVSADGSTPRCHYGKLPNFPTVTPPTAHSTWKVQVISTVATSTPVVDIAISWPAYDPKITLGHGRLQGTASGTPEGLNGFDVTFETRAAGALSVTANWTVITTDVSVALDLVSSTPSINVNSKQFKNVTKIDPAYTCGVDGAKTYRFVLRDPDAYSFRPDLTAQIAFP